MINAKSQLRIRPRKKIRIKSLERNKDDILVIYNSHDDIDIRNRRKKIMLKNIRSQSRIKLRKKIKEEKKLKEKNEKKNLELLEFRKKLYEEHEKFLEIRRIKEEKEKKELEELRRQREEKRILLTEERNKRLADEKNRRKLLELIEQRRQEELMKLEMEKKKKLLEEKKRKEQERLILLEKQRVNQIEEHKKILEKLKEIKSKKLEQIKIKEINLSKREKIEALFNKIKPKGISFLKGEISDLKEKVEFVNEIENYLREEINYNYISIANNLISPSGAIYYNNNNYIVKILGYIGSELSLYNINNIYIEKHPTNEFIRDITFKIITSGLATQTIYKLIIESPNKINEFRNNIEKWIKFNELIKEKIYDFYNISRDDICLFNYDIDNLELFLIIYNKHLNGIPILLKNFGVKTIIKPLLNYIILSPNFFEIEFCRKPSDWNENNLIRGGKKYYPPNEYFGLALKIKEKYNKYDNVWFGKIGEKEGEWPVAYHGVGRGNVFMKVFSILNEGLKVGPRQLYKNRISKANLDDFNLCEKGVYLAPDIKEAEKYADKINLGSFKNKFQFVIMTRVNPKKIRDPGGIPVNWILNGNEEEIRQYRLLIKISSN